MARFLHLYDTGAKFREGYRKLDIGSLTVTSQDFTPTSATVTYLAEADVTFPEEWWVESGRFQVYRSGEAGIDMLLKERDVYGILGEEPLILLSSATFEYTDGHEIPGVSWDIHDIGINEGAYREPWASYTTENSSVAYNTGKGTGILELDIRDDGGYELSPVSMSPGFVSVTFRKDVDGPILGRYRDEVTGERLVIRRTDGRRDKTLPYVKTAEGQFLSPVFLGRNFINGEEDLSVFDEVLHSYPLSQSYTRYFGYRYMPLLGETPWCCSFFVNGAPLNGPCMA